MAVFPKLGLPCLGPTAPAQSCRYPGLSALQRCWQLQAPVPSIESFPCRGGGRKVTSPWLLHVALVSISPIGGGRGAKSPPPPLPGAKQPHDLPSQVPSKLSRSVLADSLGGRRVFSGIGPADLMLLAVEIPFKRAIAHMTELVWCLRLQSRPTSYCAATR